MPGQWVRTVAGAVLAIWLVLPIIPMAVWSVSHGWFSTDLLPRALSLKAWHYALSDLSGVIDSLALTLFISLAATLLSLIIGVPAGRAFGTCRFRGKRLLEIVMLAPTIVPGIAVVFGIHFIFIMLGLNNTVLGVILVHLVPTLPFTTLISAAVFANLDQDLEAQARATGATWWQTWLFVTIPAVLPGLAIAGMFAFLVSWSQYILTLMIGGGRVVTLPLLLFNFATSGRNDIAGAITMIYIVPGLILIGLSARHLSGRGAAMTLLGRS